MDNITLSPENLALYAKSKDIEDLGEAEEMFAKEMEGLPKAKTVYRLYQTVPAFCEFEVPEQMTFSTESEFNNIPLIKNWKSKERFERFWIYESIAGNGQLDRCLMVHCEGDENSHCIGPIMGHPKWIKKTKPNRTS